VFYSILLVAAIAALLYGAKRWQALPEDQRKGFALKGMLWGAAVIIVALVLAGRAHWLMGVLAALIALAGRAVQLAQYVPAFKKVFDEFDPTSKEDRHVTADQGEMSRKEASELLGVTLDASADEVRLAHKKLMQKIHPDRGGTDALAKQINLAKDKLLD
jgi:hypothetical protein